MSGGATIRVGIGGWVFPPWRGMFYPPGSVAGARARPMPAARSPRSRSTAPFTAAQKPASFRRWHDETPDDFVFSVKGPRFVTHRKRSGDGGPVDRAVFRQRRPRTGREARPDPVAVRAVPALRRGRLRRLFWRCCRTRSTAAVCATSSRCGIRASRHPPSPSCCASIGVAVALVDDEKYPTVDEVTADFVYARLRRCVRWRSPAGYSPDALDDWAARAPRLASRRPRLLRLFHQRRQDPRARQRRRPCCSGCPR